MNLRAPEIFEEKIQKISKINRLKIRPKAENLSVGGQRADNYG